MEPIKININVTLDASDKLLQAVQALTGAKAPAAAAPKPVPLETKTYPKPETKEAPAPEEAPAEAAAPEATEISDEELRAIIKETRTASSPAAVRALFNEFGIKTSIECPMERRAELVARLKNLAA